jgi:hypothetical protein
MNSRTCLRVARLGAPFSFAWQLFNVGVARDIYLLGVVQAGITQGANLPTLCRHVVDRNFCHLRCRGGQLTKFPGRLLAQSVRGSNGPIQCG